MNKPGKNPTYYLLFLLTVLIGITPGVLFGETETFFQKPDESQTKACLRFEADSQAARIPFVSWDTEGGERAQTNLLRANAAVLPRICINGSWRDGTDFPTEIEKTAEGIHYQIHYAKDSVLIWTLQTDKERLSFGFSFQGKPKEFPEILEIVFPFNPQVTPTTVLPHRWNADGTLVLPAVISAPDFGQMILSAESNRQFSARLMGSRAKKTVDLILDLPISSSVKQFSLHLKPLWLPPPEEMKDAALWAKVRRGWFGALQPSAQWGDSGNPFSAPAGKLANNVISDPASCSLWFYADQAFWTPKIAEDISVADLVRQTIDWWLDERTQPDGEVICYWDKKDFLDANAGPLIAAWDYVESTGDREWLQRRIEKLEFISSYLEKRDIDGDGMVEAVQSGNRNSLLQPGRSCAWWDALNCGHKDGYTNALIYRAWRCLADLETKLSRNPQQSRYTQLADGLKSAYQKTLFNPQTGWLAWWKSADGELHDYATPIVNGLAIEYGLIDPPMGREILKRLRDKMKTAGFTRFDLGVPPMLIPVHRSDYLLPDAIGIPKREDGTDTFGQYMNGGITAGQVLHFIAAHYAVGEYEQGDFYLQAMLERQSQGGFQNGVRDKGGQGIDWTTWDGKPSGYEGFLADSFRFLESAILRDRACSQRFYRPLLINN